MRKWITLCLPFLLLAVLTACAQTVTKQNPETDSTPPKEEVDSHEKTIQLPYPPPLN